MSTDTCPRCGTPVLDDGETKCRSFFVGRHFYETELCRTFQKTRKLEAEIKELKEAAERIGCNRYNQVNRAQSAAVAAIKVAEELAEFTMHAHLDPYEPCPATWDEDKGKWINCKCGLSKAYLRLESARKSLRDL